MFVVAESFNEIAVSEELTPTLYKLVHDGFYFKNYYVTKISVVTVTTQLACLSRSSAAFTFF